MLLAEGSVTQEMDHVKTSVDAVVPTMHQNLVVGEVSTREWERL